MKMNYEQEFQVNLHYSVNGETTTSITKYSEDGYVGNLVDTQYEDGADSTDWCIFHGSMIACKLKARKIMQEYLRAECPATVDGFKEYHKRTHIRYNAAGRCDRSVFDSLRAFISLHFDWRGEYMERAMCNDAPWEEVATDREWQNACRDFMSQLGGLDNYVHHVLSQRLRG